MNPASSPHSSPTPHHLLTHHYPHWQHWYYYCSSLGHDDAAAAAWRKVHSYRTLPPLPSASCETLVGVLPGYGHPSSPSYAHHLEAVAVGDGAAFAWLGNP